MDHARANRLFLDSCGAETRARILRGIADHYGISPVEAFAEVTHAEAEHLADYMTTPERFAVFARMEHAARLERRRAA